MVAGYEFRHYRLDTRARLLFRNGQRVVLTPKAVDLLIALVEAQGQTVDKHELLRRVWPDTVVEEGSLSSHIFQLRRALGEGAGGQRFIETIPKRGYRFVSPCAQLGSSAPAAGVGRLMLVVLPFENLSGGRKHDYFSEGLTEEMISQLARLNPEQLGVIARTSAMQYKSTTKTPQQIGRELGVSHLLEGSVRRAGGRVRITAQLIRVSDATHLWAEGYERELHDILALQAQVARAIAREIQITLTVRADRRLDRVAALDPGAHEAYLRGRHLWNLRTEEGMRKGIAQYEEAIRLQPDYATAYAGLADSHVMLACRGMVPAKDSLRTPKAAGLRASPNPFGRMSGRGWGACNNTEAPRRSRSSRLPSRSRITAPRRWRRWRPRMRRSERAARRASSPRSCRPLRRSITFCLTTLPRSTRRPAPGSGRSSGSSGRTRRATRI